MKKVEQYFASLPAGPQLPAFRAEDDDRAREQALAMLCALEGAFVLATGVLMVLWNCIHSLRVGRLAPADPWGANSLEWYTSSPPPAPQLRDAHE